MKLALRPVKFFQIRCEDVVKVGEICNFHVHTRLLHVLRCCKVLTGSYYAPITRAPGPASASSYHVLTTSKKITSRADHVLTYKY